MDDFGARFFKDKGEKAQRQYLENLRNEAILQKLKGNNELANAIVTKIKDTLRYWGAI